MFSIRKKINSNVNKRFIGKKKKDGMILGRPKNKIILDDKYTEIKKLLDDGVKIKKIAEKYDMSRVTISKLIKKKWL